MKDEIRGKLLQVQEVLLAEDMWQRREGTQSIRRAEHVQQEHRFSVFHGRRWEEELLSWGGGFNLISMQTQQRWGPEMEEERLGNFHIVLLHYLYKKNLSRLITYI